MAPTINGFAFAQTHLWSIVVSCALYNEMYDQMGIREWCERKYRKTHPRHRASGKQATSLHHQMCQRHHLRPDCPPREPRTDHFGAHICTLPYIIYVNRYTNICIYLCLAVRAFRLDLLTFRASSFSCQLFMLIVKWIFNVLLSFSNRIVCSNESQALIHIHRCTCARIYLRHYSIFAKRSPILSYLYDLKTFASFEAHFSNAAIFPFPRLCCAYAYIAALRCCCSFLFHAGLLKIYTLGVLFVRLFWEKWKLTLVTCVSWEFHFDQVRHSPLWSQEFDIIPKSISNVILVYSF